MKNGNFGTANEGSFREMNEGTQKRSLHMMNEEMKERSRMTNEEMEEAF